MGKPVVTIDIGPLCDDQWTGIPIFTKRLIAALDRTDRCSLRFCRGAVDVPPSFVFDAFKVGTGAFLRDKIARLSAPQRSLVDPKSFFLFPSVKGEMCLSPRESSTVHDLSTLVMPEYHVKENVAHHMDHFQHELDTNEIVFCVSDATRSALSLAFPDVAHKARTLYQHVDWPENFDTIERNMPALRLPPYAVVIGTIEPRKNLELLLKALSQPEIEKSGLSFVIIGRKGWKVDAFLENLSERERTRLIFSGFVSEFVKYRLIKSSKFMIYPSIYEGFGIPALEAMSLGKPVLAARTSSLPEVIGDAGLYFDPLSPSDFSAAFGVMDSDRFLNSFRSKAISRNQRFNWQTMAQPVVDWVTAA